MSLTLIDLMDRLKKVDEISLLEVLDISSEDIIDRFSDKIEDRFDYLVGEFQDDSIEEN